MTRQQDWARKAHLAVSHMKGQNGESEYRTFCMKGPALIQRAGAVQALAFLLSRNEGRGEDYARDLASAYGTQSPRNLLDLARSENCNLTTYLALTRDLIQVAAWFRRFAQIELEGSQD